MGCPIETRGVIAQFEAATRQLTVWSNTQTPHILRGYLSEMLRMREDAIRVVKPDMGGSFGGGIYPEEIAVAAAAIILDRPVRWIEDRQENLANARHSRDQWHEVRVGYNLDGTIVALLDDIVADSGAYNPFNVTLSFNAASHIRNQFSIENMRVHARHALTNKQPATPVRGAGRTEATFVMDRIADLVAADLGMDPAELRLLNLIPAASMPRDMGMYYRNGRRLVYDSGDYPAQLRTALEAVGYAGFREAPGGGPAGRPLPRDRNLQPCRRIRLRTIRSRKSPDRRFGPGHSRLRLEPARTEPRDGSRTSLRRGTRHRARDHHGPDR